MAYSSLPDGGARFPELLSLRLPSGFLAKIREAAEAEGIPARDFARRAIADRLEYGAPDRSGDGTVAPLPAAPEHRASPPPPRPPAEPPAPPTSLAPSPAPAADAPAPRQRRDAWTPR